MEIYPYAVTMTAKVILYTETFKRKQFLNFGILQSGRSYLEKLNRLKQWVNRHASMGGFVVNNKIFEYLGDLWSNYNTDGMLYCANYQCYDEII
jgi:hypothetical protein